jgi:hypothetical protein
MNSDKILPKLALVKGELGSVTKSADNPFFRSKYADLNAHIDVVEPLLQKHGLILLQPTCRDQRGSYVRTVILDSESGQFVSSELDLILVKNDMQQMGSAVTYARRYTLGALLAMKAEDDDGNAASSGERRPVKKTKTPAKTPSYSNDEF